MLTWGLLVIIVNIAYLLLSMLIGYLAYKFFKHKYKHIGKIVFIVVLLAPFWDLIIQKGVKTYYQAFMMEAKIYAYPELDEDGKIESLDLGNTSRETISYFVDYLNLGFGKDNFSSIDIKKFKIDDFIKETDFDEKIKNFLELKVFDDNGERKRIRIRLDDVKPQFEFIEKGIARYKIEEESENYFFKLYIVDRHTLVDNKTGKVLAKDMRVDFKKGSKNKFRNKILLWKSANDSAYSLKDIEKKWLMSEVLNIKNVR